MGAKKEDFTATQSRELGFAANISRIWALEDELQLALIKYNFTLFISGRVPTLGGVRV